MGLPSKQELRRELIRRRDAIPAEARRKKSQEICRELWALAENSRARTIAVYAAMGSEAQLDPFIARAYKRGACLTFPAMLPVEQDGQRMQMHAVPFADFKSGVAPFISNPVQPFAPVPPEQERFATVAPPEIDLIVVPLVGFDAQGQRLGYGGGCYDRYLPALSTSCKTVGVAFAEQQVKTVPHDAYDIPLPRIISA